LIFRNAGTWHRIETFCAVWGAGHPWRRRPDRPHHGYEKVDATIESGGGFFPLKGVVQVRSSAEVSCVSEAAERPE
jgi:hypothetical protein